MYIIETRQAQKIVERLMTDIPFNINIMDNTGKIIASGDKKRIGQQHSAAERAIKEQKTIEVYRDTLSEKKGTNTPIIYNGNIIGVVGITGEPETVALFTKIVSSLVLLIIQEMADYKTQQKINSKKKMFLKRIMASSINDYDGQLRTEALEDYKMNLLEKNFCVLSKSKKIIEKVEEASSIFFYKGFYLCFVQKSPTNLTALEAESIKRLVIISEQKEDFSSMIKQAINAWYVADFFKLDNTLLKTDAIPFSFLFAIDEKVELTMLNQIKVVYDDYYETLIEFAKNNCNHNETSKKLHIHRNTLAYRLERIHELTGLDPNLWFDLCKLLHCFITFYKSYLI